jgi:class 3 adenylate cyclase
MGSVNKNLGDSYLLAWKFPDEEGVFIQKKFVLNAHSETVKQKTSLALMFAIKSISKIARSQALLSYKQTEKVLKHLKTFTSKLTFGFHVGWAYEGPIGSYFKIDASYLSPNVNTASRIESVTKQYGVQILCSEEFYIRLDSNVQPFLRHIDTVTLKGVASSIKLYSFDCSPAGLVISHAKPTKHKVDKKRKRLQEAIDSQTIQVHSLFTESDEIAEMRKSFSEFFFNSYVQALNLYLEGHWREARQVFKSQCLNAVPLDGPSQAIVEFIDEHNAVPPISWTGVRELLHK